MKLVRTLPLLVLGMAIVTACGGDDDAADQATGTTMADDGAAAPVSGHHPVFDVDSCELLTAQEVEAAGIDWSAEHSEPPDRIGDVGGDGNVCVWGGNELTVGSSPGSIDTDAEPDARESTLDGRRVLQQVRDDGECVSKIEVAEQVYVLVSVRGSIGGGSDCDPVDELLPLVSSRIPDGDDDVDGATPDDDDGGGGGEAGATVPADAEVTSELICGALAGSEIPVPGFDAQGSPGANTATGDASCDWGADGGGRVHVWYTAVNTVSSNDPPLSTDGREGSLESFDDKNGCMATFVRGDGAIHIEVYDVDDYCGVAEELAQLLAPRFPQAA